MVNESMGSLKEADSLNPFSDLRVVELSTAIAGPWCARLLADMGCDVVKVEPLEGDSMRRYGPFPKDGDRDQSGMFLYLNANKRGVTADVHTPEGHKFVTDLLATADVFVVDLPPAEQRSLGFVYEELSITNPRLIVTSITPFGMSGPNSDLRSYDVNISAASGISVGIGEPNRYPLTFPLFQCSFQGGGAAAAATLCALIARKGPHGKGQQVEIAIEEVLATQHSGRALPTFIYQGITGMRSGRRPRYGLYPQTVLPCKDGYIAFSAPQLQQWIRFLKVMGDPEWSKNPRYRDRRAMAEEYPDEADGLILPWLSQHTKSEILGISLENKLPFAPFMNGSEIIKSSVHKERDFLWDLSLAGLGYWAPGPPYRLSELPFRVRQRAPNLGEHNSEFSYREANG